MFHFEFATFDIAPLFCIQQLILSNYWTTFIYLVYHFLLLLKTKSYSHKKKREMFILLLLFITHLNRAPAAHFDS
ncbi:hypothetical protein BDF21DRAFT_422452 [Thamnidium elegans]|nr:hypothetical protein BDF21DRAFT_422452 [Thamnidium elegans]